MMMGDGCGGGDYYYYYYYLSYGFIILIAVCRSQWPRGLRRRSAAARTLRSRVESHRGHGCLSLVSVVCFRVEVSATS
jgi:hypothetical protein